MLTQKNKRIVIIKALIFICLTFTVYSKGAEEVEQIAKVTGVLNWMGGISNFGCQGIL